MVVPKINTVNMHPFSPPNSMNAYSTQPIKPDNTIFNIQRDCFISKPSIRGPRSPAMSPLPSASLDSAIDYAERVAKNNMDIVEDDSFFFKTNT